MHNIILGNSISFAFASAYDNDRIAVVLICSSQHLNSSLTPLLLARDRNLLKADGMLLLGGGSDSSAHRIRDVERYGLFFTVPLFDLLFLSTTIEFAHTFAFPDTFSPKDESSSASRAQHIYDRLSSSHYSPRSIKTLLFPRFNEEAHKFLSSHPKNLQRLGIVMDAKSSLLGNVVETIAKEAPQHCVSLRALYLAINPVTFGSFFATVDTKLQNCLRLFPNMQDLYFQRYRINDTDLVLDLPFLRRLRHLAFREIPDYYSNMCLRNLVGSFVDEEEEKEEIATLSPEERKKHQALNPSALHLRETLETLSFDRCNRIETFSGLEMLSNLRVFTFIPMYGHKLRRLHFDGKLVHPTRNDFDRLVFCPLLRKVMIQKSEVSNSFIRNLFLEAANLEFLNLERCETLFRSERKVYDDPSPSTSLPSIGEMMSKPGAVRAEKNIPPSLVTLEITSCSTLFSLNDIFGFEDEINDDLRKLLYGRIKSLDVSYCMNLRDVSAIAKYMVNIQSQKMYDCPKLPKEFQQME